MSGWRLAQVNIGRLRAPLDDPQLAAFVEALDPVNAAADEAPGFVWRLQTDEGNATAVEAFPWDTGESAGMIINLSVWADVEHLTAFVLGDLHRAILRRRREFFHRMTEAYLACWWISEGHLPSTDEAEQRVRSLRANGPTPFAFTLRHHFPPPDDEAAGEVLGNDGDRLDVETPSHNAITAIRDHRVRNLRTGGTEWLTNFEWCWKSDRKVRSWWRWLRIGPV